MRLFALLLAVASLVAVTLAASVPPRGGDDLQLQSHQKKRFLFEFLDPLTNNKGSEFPKAVVDQIKKVGQKKLPDLTKYVQKIKTALTGDFGKRSDLSETLQLLASDFDIFKGNLDSIQHYITEASKKSENKRQFGSNFDLFKGNVDSIQHYLTQGNNEGSAQKRFLFLNSVVKVLNHGSLKTQAQGLAKAGVKKVNDLTNAGVKKVTDFTNAGVKKVTDITKAGVKKVNNLVSYLNQIKNGLTGDFGKRDVLETSVNVEKIDVLDFLREKVDDAVDEVVAYLQKHVHA